MIFRNINEIENSERDISWGNGQSRRFLIASDGMGYSLTDTVINEGTTSLLKYKNHLETCYCIEGEGEVKTTSDGKTYPLTAGAMYALNKNDEHYLTAHSTMRLVCVFNPALNGKEVHDLDGANGSHY